MLENGPISPSTTVRATRGARKPLAPRARLPGEREKRYYSRQFGSHRGNPWTVIYASRHRLPEESCWLPGDR
jgi:hypothetical protein